MCCALQTGLNREQAKKRALAIAVLVCVTVVSLLSHVFMLTHAGHEHDHKGLGGACAVCAQVQNAVTVLKQLVMAVAGSLYVLAGCFAVAAIIRAAHSEIVLLTPVVLKIRMDR